MVFDKSWFDKNQKILLKFANTRLGRYILRIHGNRSSVGKNKIIKIEPNAIWWGLKELGKDFQVTAEFRSNNKFARRFYHAFKPVWWIMHFIDWLLFDRFIKLQRLNFGFSTLTQYPSTIGAGNPKDGAVGRNIGGQTFANIRAGAGNFNETTLAFGLYFNPQSSTLCDFLTRLIFCFDTSSLTAGATITPGGCTLSVFGTAKANPDGSTNFITCAAGSAGITSLLQSSDYAVAGFGSVDMGSLTYAAYSTSAYNDITLNTDGENNISKTGVTSYGARFGWDFNNNFAGVAGNGQNYYRCRYASNTGTTEDPKLVVTYTAPVSAISTFTLLGVG